MNFLYRCNILICPHFPVYKGGLHEWNTRLCMSSGLCSTSFSIFCAPQEIYRNGASVYFCTSWVSGILCKSECYTGITHSHENTCICLIFLLLTLILPANYFQASVKCRKAQKCLYLTLSIQCHMQLKLFMSLTAV